MLSRYPIIVGSVFLLLGTPGSTCANDPLQQVEDDQAHETHDSRGLFSRNIALNNRRDFTHASSYAKGRFPWHAHDGNAKTAWITDSEQDSAFLEISWGLAEAIDSVRVREHNPNGIQSLTIQLYDGKRWEAIAAGREARQGNFRFAPRLASALRITIETNGAPAGIAEVEVHAARPAAMVSRHGSADLIAALETNNAAILFEGSPYVFSRGGRKLIVPRIAEASLADEWAQAVLACVCATLGGKSEAAGESELRVTLNKRTFTLAADRSLSIVDQISLLADRAGLEFLRRGPLVIVGRGVDSFNRPHLAAELEGLLGQNPYRPRSRPEGPADAVVAPSLDRTGTTYEWAGFRATAVPGTNAAAWLKYADTKAVRTWVNAARYMNPYIRPRETIKTADDFERCRALVRSSPEHNEFVAMQAFLEKHHTALAAEFGTYNTLGIDVINQTAPKDWPDTLNDDFINWAGSYEMTYYLARNFGVAAHQFGNEPDAYFNESTDEQICRRLAIIADAVHSAIADVNRDCDRKMTAIFSAPVLASDFKGRSAKLMMRHLRTRYDGSKSSDSLFQLFNRHRYGGRPHQNALEVRQAKQMMQDEGGEVLPQVFTEINYATGRTWARPTTTFTNDTPDVFASVASIWGWMMHEQGVYGIFVFKMNDPAGWTRNDTGRFSNVVTYSMHREQDLETDRNALEHISYGTKNFEVCRLFSKGFHGSRPLLQTDVECSDPEYRSWTTIDEASRRFFIWSVQIDELIGYELEFDLSRLGLPPGTLITAETVSGAHHGEVTHVMSLPESRKIRLHQPPKSGMLLTLHTLPLDRQIVPPVADATVTQGESAEHNFGTQPWLRVGRHTLNDKNHISYLKFELPEEPAPVQRAVLQVHGQSIGRHPYDGGFLFRIYSVRENAWEEQQITAMNAPNLCRTVASMSKVDLLHHPVGHATCFHESSAMQVDVTQAVQDAQRDGRQYLTLVLIREIHWPGEKTDDESAHLSSRETAVELAPALHLWKEAVGSGRSGLP